MYPVDPPLDTEGVVNVPENPENWLNVVNVDSTSVLYLDLELSEEPVEGSTVIVKSGTKNKGKQYRYNGTSWVECQQKTKVQQG